MIIRLRHYTDRFGTELDVTCILYLRSDKRLYTLKGSRKVSVCELMAASRIKREFEFGTEDGILGGAGILADKGCYRYVDICDKIEYEERKNQIFESIMERYALLKKTDA